VLALARCLERPTDGPTGGARANAARDWWEARTDGPFRSVENVVRHSRGAALRGRRVVVG
jgi:hypothetical protein